MKLIIAEWLAKKPEHSMRLLSRLSGINYKQIWHYANGRWLPNEANTAKILAVVDKCE